MPKKATRPPVGINPNIPLPVQRELRNVAQFAFDAQDKADAANETLKTKVGMNSKDLLQVSQFVSGQVQAGGKFPINLTGLNGRAQNQLAYIPTVSLLPLRSNPLATSGQAVIYKNQLYVFGALVGSTGSSAPAPTPPGTFVPVTSPQLEGTAATLATTTPGAAGSFFWVTDQTVLYISTGTVWQYALGQMEGNVAAVPASLGVNDVGFLFFENAVYFHQIQWTGTAWQRGPGDRDRADTFVDFGAVPAEAGWHACDGSTVAFFNYVTPSAPGSRVLPNLAATPAYSNEGSTYSPAVIAAVVPTATIGSGSIDAGTGAPTTVAEPPVSVSLPGDPIANYSVIRMYRM